MTIKNVLTLSDIPWVAKKRLLLVTSHWIRRIYMYVHLYKKIGNFFLQCLIICLFTCVLLFEFYDTSLKRNWDVSTERLIWFQGAHSWWMSEPGIKLSHGPAQGSRVEGKTAWGNHLSHQLQTPLLFIYIPLLSILARRLPKLHIFYKAYFPETPVSHCPSSSSVSKPLLQEKGWKKPNSVFRGKVQKAKGGLFWKLCGGYFLLLFGGGRL